MNARTLLLAFAALAAMASPASDDVQVVYRGRLAKAGAAPGAQTVSMEFRLYASKGDPAPSWSMATNVLVDAQGLFQVALRGEGLAEAVDGGRAAWIGVSVDGGKEQYPRQELMAAPFAAKAARADALAGSPEIGEVSAVAFSAEKLATESVSVDGKTSLPDTGPVTTTLALEGDWNGATLPAKGDVRFFGRSAPRDLGTKTASGGGCEFGTADGNCVAVFAATGTDRMPAASMLFKKGEEIALPAAAGLPDGATVRCFVYSIGVE